MANTLYIFTILLLSILTRSSTLPPPEVVNSNLQIVDREAYFNGSSYLVLSSSISMHRHSGLSFRTCEGGRLYQQTFSNGDSVFLDVNEEGLHFVAVINQELYQAKLNGNMLNNVWQNVNLFFRLGNLTLSAAGHTQIIANATYNSAILMLPDKVANGLLIIGEGFRGCILQGPGVLFNYTINYKDVVFGPCPAVSCGPSSVNGRTRFTTTTMDHCKNLPCMTGKCINRQYDYECHCSARYSGKNCEHDHGSACWGSPCRNGGTCNEIQNGEEYMCTCPHSFTGRHCESQIGARICDANPCRNDALCVELLDNDYKCNCKAGWTGKNCDVNVSECESSPCENNGVCIDGVNNYTCSCERTGYEGVHCENDIDECLKKPCLNSGECHNQYGGYVCVCPPEYTGQNCELNTNECESSPCMNGGTCIDQVGGFICNCPKGFAGPLCKEATSKSCEDADCPANSVCVKDDVGIQCVCNPGLLGNPPNCTINYCSNNPCANGGTCTSKADTFECTCPSQWKGKTCKTTTDYCSLKPCQHGGACVSKPNGFSCNCTKDYMGDNCELEYDACALKPCQHNGTCTLVADSKHDFICTCPKGYEGKFCDVDVDDCADVICPDNRVCVDKVASYECQCRKGFGGPNCTELVDPCAANPCKNSANCTNLDGGLFECQCEKGWKGERCDTDIDECHETNESVCVHGICVNKEGGYQCFCTPGYSGDHCDLDIDECLCGPCKNNATCINRVNSFKCRCPSGYEGVTCEKEIDECATNPCLNGATCIDKVADYECVCSLGFDGHNCENNIDDCLHNPCENGGKCIDGINSYSCDCADTGFEGENCEYNIDDCLQNDCKNNATCVDEVKGYHCECYPGYDGLSCENDINECESAPCQYNGTCLERSVQELYTNDFTNKPAIFNQPFSYENASGYECICVQGITGVNCETNIDECKSNPCKAGVCMDRIGSYTCECDKGFEGEHCEYDIDECVRYQPCKHGTCIDKRADYFCACEPGYGGKNCSVELIGCQENACKNGGTCFPHLINETEHTFNCTCSNGYYGDVCDFETTMSLNGKSSYILASTTRDEGYDIQLRFRTTLPNGLLAMGKGGTLFMLELVNGKLNLHTSLLNKWEGVFIGGGLNDSNWQKVFIAINATHVVLSANEEQTIYPISSNEGYNANNTTFPTTFVGGTNASFKHLTHVQPFFVGCIQDVVINGEWIHSGVVSDNLVMVDVEQGCPREEKCDPNPCKNGGHCTDMWRNFSCKCERPYLGHTCQYNMTAATFGYENITDGFVTVKPTPAARSAVKSIIDISMFIRTREERGDIFYLGSELDSQSQLKENTYIYAQLVGGELLPRIQFNGTEGSPITIAKLNDGNTHLIQIIRNVSLVQVKINGTEYFRKTIGANGLINTTVLYLGGLPPAYHFIRQSDNDSKEPATSPRDNFKGIIQDVQISNGTNTMVVEFYPLKAKDIPPPLSFGNVTFNHSKILQGVVSDNVCVSDPCLHNGTCHVTWNDFWCECPRGYTGKICDEMEFCQLQDCPAGSKCQNLDDGYECLANATFDGSNTFFTYTFEQSDTNITDESIDSMEITYRSNTGGTLMDMSTTAGQQHLTVSVHRDNITLTWKLSAEYSGFLHIGKEEPDGDWATIIVKLNNNSIEFGYANTDENNEYQTSSHFNYALWYNLLRSGSVTLGGMDITPTDRHSYLTLNDKQLHDQIDANSVSFAERKLTTPMPPHSMISGEAFKGCLGEVRIGNMLLHYFSHNQVYMNSNFTPSQYFSLRRESNITNHETIGCQLCFDEECKNKGYCLDKYSSYICDCPAGYAEDDCSVDIDECVDNGCKNGAECIDGIANYTCKCNSGWEGRYCEKDINECEPENPCQHDGVCHNIDGSFLCECSDQFVGKYCENYKLITCNNRPCRNGSTCIDGTNLKTLNNFTCLCMPGFVGEDCSEPFCAKDPCQNDGRCVVRYEVPQCDCVSGFVGHYCEINKDDCVIDSADNSPPCKNDGRCIDGINSYTCDCSGTGYTGKDCSIDINECEIPTVSCGFGECQNLNGTYLCECTEGYCGANCTMPNPCETNYCQNGGTCDCDESGAYICHCPLEFSGVNCTEPTLGLSSQGFNIAIIVGPIVACLLIIAAGSLIALFMMARKKRATRGTYSPSAQEFSNPRVEMDNVMKPPPEERLI